MHLDLTFLVIIALGKFHGVIMAATPMGSRMKTSCLLLVEVETTSPLILRASSLNHSKNDSPYVTSPRASTMGLP